MQQYFLTSLLLISFANIGIAEESLLQQAVNGNHRSEKHTSRDSYRHPLETLSFFELEPEMTVVEIWPGGNGWYSEILAPFLKEKGLYYAAHFSASSDIPYFSKSLEKYRAKTKAQPAIYSHIKITSLHPPQQVDIAPENSVDRVLTFRNIHNWMKSDQLETVFKAMYRALKPGGLLGVVEHRAPAKTEQDPKALSGYVTEATVIDIAEQVGFKFIARSEINSNPKDNTLHPKGVWTLPPTLRLKDQDFEKYLTIGESDRMSLKFAKP